MMQSRRSTFSRQPARILFIDMEKPFDITSCGTLIEALRNVMAIACTISGPCRLPFFGLFALGPYPEQLFTLQNVIGNFGRLLNALGQLDECMRKLHEYRKCWPEDGLKQGIREAVESFRRKAKNLFQTAGYWIQLEVTVVTCRNPSSVIRQVENALDGLSLDNLKKIQVLHMSNAERLRTVDEGEISESQSSSDKSQSSDGVLVDCVSLEEDIVCIERFFKKWLQDCSTDVEHMHLHMPAHDGPDLVLKCDLHERILCPGQLPISERFVVRCDSPVMPKPGNLSQGSRHQTPLYQLRVIQKLPRPALCESVLFDTPLIVNATSCWKMDWDELETNQQHFTALCHLLKEKDQVLMAVLEEEPPPVRKPRAAPPTLSPHFVLLPAPSGSLLLKAVAVRELLMPCDLGTGNQPVEASLQTLASHLHQIEEVEGFNPLTASSNCYKCLEARLKKSNYHGAGVRGAAPNPGGGQNTRKVRGAEHGPD